MALTEQLDAVQKAVSEKNPELARNLLRLLIQDYPESAEVWYQAARVAINEKQRRAFLEKAVELDPLHHLAANELHRLQEVAQSVQTIEPSFYAPEPEIVQEIVYATFWYRLLATFIDSAIIMIVAIPLMVILLIWLAPDFNSDSVVSINDHRAFIIVLLPLYLTGSIYSAYFLPRKKGQTPGKQLLRIRVVKCDNTAITIWEAILRNVIGYQLSYLLYGLGFLWMFADKKSQTWHDHLSNTIVVRV